MTTEPAKAGELRTRLRALLRTKQQLLIEPAARPAASQLLSHIGGDPYFEQGETWPTNPDTGQPLELIFQLVNDDGCLPGPSRRRWCSSTRTTTGASCRTTTATRASSA